MINPCKNCPRRAEYDEYDKHLDEIMLTKKLVVTTTSPGPKKTSAKKGKKAGRPVAKPRSGGLSNKAFFKEMNKCSMGGCERFATVMGYCKSCYALRRYHAAKGNPVPDSLSLLQIKMRGGKR